MLVQALRNSLLTCPDQAGHLWPDLCAFQFQVEQVWECGLVVPLSRQVPSDGLMTRQVAAAQHATVTNGIIGDFVSILHALT